MNFRTGNHPPPQLSDLNDRERERFARELRGLAKMANAAADAVEKGDDSLFAVHLIALSLTGGGIVAQIGRDFASAIHAKKSEEFPEILDG